MAGPTTTRSSRAAKKGVNPEVYHKALQLLSDVDDASAVTDELLALGAGGRAAERAVVAALERRPDATVVVQLLTRAGLSGGGADEYSVRRLLRLARGREPEATRRSNPVARKEGFTCLHCGQSVPASSGGMQRNHCPACLYSRHVDEVPGDRASECGGLMAPVGVEELCADSAILRHRCVLCGAERRNRAALDAEDQPDSQQALRKLAARDPQS